MKNLLLLLAVLFIYTRSYGQQCSDHVKKTEDKFDKSIRYSSIDTLNFYNFGDKISVVISKFKHMDSYVITFQCRKSNGDPRKVMANAYVYFLFDDNSSFKVHCSNSYEDPGGDISLVFNSAVNTAVLSNLLTKNVVSLRINYEGYDKDFDLNPSQISFFKTIMNCMDY